MNLGEIEQQVASLDTDQGFDLIYDLLRAYGLPKASIARLRTGTRITAQIERTSACGRGRCITDSCKVRKTSTT